MNDRAVIFDMDGVLVDSYTPHFQSWRDMGRECGIEMTEAEFATTFGRTSREIIEHFWGAGLSDARIAEMDRHKEALYRTIIAKDFPEMDGAHELLAALHGAEFKLAVGSSGPPENVAVVKERLGIAGLFDATVTGMDVTRGKPDPQVFLMAAERLGVPPRRCAVVEDARAGLQAARAAGMSAIAITGTFQRDSLTDLADLVVDSLRELNARTVTELIDRR